MNEVMIERGGAVDARELVELRSSDGSEPEHIEDWTVWLDEAYCTVTARQIGTGLLVGAGFIRGDSRHAVLADNFVHPDFRRQGIGGKIFDARVAFVDDLKVPYVWLTYDPKQPWLKEFYERHGFVEVRFGMCLKRTLENVR